MPASPAPRTRNPLPSTVSRLDDARVLRRDEAMSWLVTAGITLIGFLLRVVNLGRPGRLMFDETYYAKDAWALLHFGYEVSWPQGADAQVAAGTTNVWTLQPGTNLPQASFIVHPQLGKWLIAIGEQLFGMNSFGWRFSALIFGSLLIAVTIRMARRLSRSTLIGALAGLFLCVDGLSFVMSRIALLDVFEAFFTVAAVAAWLADRDWFRCKLADYLRTRKQANLGGSYGPLLLFRPWRLASGVLFGLAMGSKWNAVYVLAVFGVLSVILDWRARRTAGAGTAAARSILSDGAAAFVQLVLVAIPVYFATWWSWLTTSGGWDRQWGAQHPDSTLVRLFGKDFASLLWYHKEIYDFHTGDWIAHQGHIYAAHPFGWPWVGRVIGIDAVNDIQPGTDGCTAVHDTCLRVISGQGTPLLWWSAAIAAILGLGWWIFGRDIRFGVVLLAAGATWLGWMPNAARPTFYFYAIMMIPFTATGLAMALGKALGPADAGRRRRMGAIAVGALVALIVADFWFIYPILTDELMTRQAWSLRMWFRSWI